MIAGEGAQRVEVALREGTGTQRQIAQEVHDLDRGVGHLGLQRDFGEIRIAEQVRFFVAQGKDLGHHLRIVELRSAEFAGAGGIGAVQALAQRAMFAMLQHRHVGGVVQGELVALAAIALRGFARSLQGVWRDAGDLVLADMLGMGRGGVEHMLGKGLAQRGQPLLDLRIAGARLALQQGAAQTEIAQGVAGDALAGR
ncbi:hypothetical protein GALL_436890 [mine drainage metagenome]|uniref:Uncharacterized protein n=1 Tax=mine drainage metagenome TaxID=410659 RepID=A0A1J5Q3U5_9ZZZZ